MHIIFINVEWIYVYEASKITVCKLCSTDKGLTVTLSLTVQDNFSWDLRYKGDIVQAQSCQYLQGLPFLVNSGINCFKPTCYAKYWRNFGQMSIE